MYNIIVALFFILFPLSIVLADTIEAPNVKVGDTWAYQFTLEKSPNQARNTQAQWVEKHYEVSVARVSKENILLSRKERKSSQAPTEALMGSNFSRFKSINGEEKIVSQPLNFPLVPGKTWKLEYTTENPNKQAKSQSTSIKYEVIGWEEVVVPAGKFKAIKIEATGNWKAELAPSQGVKTSTETSQSGSTIIMQSQKNVQTTTTGRLFRVYWYVPETKIYVKAVEENYLSSGLLNERRTEELETYKVSP